MDKPYTLLFDDQGAFAGVYISPALWEQITDQILPILRAAAGHVPAEPELQEPLDDWNTLLEYWDFPYPPDKGVSCKNCGASTDDWQADDPRRFRLRSATFGGLVSFQCQACKARIIKRHFKDGVKSETTPFVE
ncbi:hypothetical protein [Desulfocurvus sp. DL9XJH121]